jgi:class 3 adenylate cyclase/tetratricopeptide (TPR) repeat protein
MNCPNCGFENPPEMKFCGQCGTQLGWTCSVCSAINFPDHRFCGQCGTIRTEELAAEGTSQPAAITPDAKAAPDVSLEAVLSPDTPPATIEGERRLATVILADVVGSTDLLEQLGSEAWVEVMNRVLQLLEREVYRFGGEVDQFRGDGLVAFFGATSAQEDDPELAVLSALGMQIAIKPLVDELVTREGIDVQLRVGVNTGEVIVTSIGDTGQHSEDTAMGEAIALAARMEEAAEPGTVLVSENTYNLAEPQFEWVSLGEIMVKGVSDPVAVYRPVKAVDEADHLHGLRPHVFEIGLIGRESEFNTLKDSIEFLRKGRGGIVMVTGETGMGKSSLVANVQRHFVREEALLADKRYGEHQPAQMGDHEQGKTIGTLTWLQGRCRSYSQSLPYSMWIKLLKRWLGVPEGEPRTETRDRLHRQAKVLWGETAEEFYPYMATFLSLPLESAYEDRVKYLNAEGLRHQFFLTIWNWVKAMSEQGPLVLAFEDVHWADSSSLDLLEQCLPLCDEEALVWLIVTRPERGSAAWEFRQRVETRYPHRMKHLDLAPLVDSYGSEFIDRLIGPGILPQETHRLLLERAEGNPYYIEVFIRSLIRRGILVHDGQDDIWRMTREVETLELPETLQSLLFARIDRLTAEERRVLQIAAVVGPVFWSNILIDLSANGRTLERAELQSHLTALQRSQLIHQRGRTPELGMEYAFESNLLRDAAYEGLLSGQRAQYHEKAADYLQNLSGDETLAQNYAMLAYHYRHAGKRNQELFYTLNAAAQAKEIYANAEALEHYTHALNLLDLLESQTDDVRKLYTLRTQRFEVLKERLEIYFLAADFEARWEDARALLPLAEQLADDPVWKIDAILEQPGVAWFDAKKVPNECLIMAEEALALARQIGDRRREMLVLGAMGGQKYTHFDPTWKDLAEETIALASELGDKRIEIGILSSLGNVFVMSDPERSVEYLERAVQLSQELDDKRAELDILALIGSQLENTDDHYRRLKECHEKMLRLSREIGHRPREAYSLMFIAQIQGLSLGDYESGLALLEENLPISEGMSTKLYTMLRIAQIQTMQGKLEEALETIEAAEAVARQFHHGLQEAGISLVSAILFNAIGDETHLKKALEVTLAQSEFFIETLELSQQYHMVMACEATASHLGLAKIEKNKAKREKHLKQALESSRIALEHYRTFGFVRPIECSSAEILYRHNLALAANGHDVEAEEYLHQAHAEMMRVHDLIPPDSPYRSTYLENIPIHREIRAAFEGSKR